MRRSVWAKVGGDKTLLVIDPGRWSHRIDSECYVPPPIVATFTPCVSASPCSPRYR